ncbi:MAG TPA: type IV pilus twitching motility protein PilT [Armatimonadota bacterium]|jgi:twitching motility protein PilT
MATEEKAPAAPQPQAPGGMTRPAKAQRKPIDVVHIDELLEIVVETNASDLHLCVGLPPIMRIDGELKATRYELFEPPIVQRMIYDILTDDQVQRFETEMELDCSYAMRKIARFRVNVYRDRGNVAAALRLIPTKIPSIQQLGLPPIIEDLAKRPRGLLLVTGPTGSGKSTTLASVINMINTERAEHIVTIEDPIEYLHTHKKSVINQREVGEDTTSFREALRRVLREDPDIILVGEMRDLETIALAVTCAETGHLVFGTLHTNNAAESVDRMIDVFPPEQQEQIRVQLSNNLVAILSQQLLPRAGQPGRVAAIEVMVATSAIRNLIRENKAHQMHSILQTGMKDGMQSMDQALRDLYKQGLITHEVAARRSHNPAELEKLIAGE